MYNRRGGRFPFGLFAELMGTGARVGVPRAWHARAGTKNSLLTGTCESRERREGEWRRANLAGTRRSLVFALIPFVLNTDCAKACESQYKRKSHYIARDRSRNSIVSRSYGAMRERWTRFVPSTCFPSRWNSRIDWSNCTCFVKWISCLKSAWYWTSIFRHN